MLYHYSIAGLSVQCQLPFPLACARELENFICDPPEDGRFDLRLRFQPVERLPAWDSSGHREPGRVYRELPGRWMIYHTPAPKALPYACMVWGLDAPAEPVCYYLQGEEHRMCYPHNLVDILGLETLLRLHSGLLLHASFIRWHGGGILFSAPSQTGKSTQADLWVRNAGAELLNGDRAGLRRVGGQWRAYGLPYAGSSGIYRNDSAPVTAIVVLRQAKENRLRPLGPGEAAAYLYPECTIHRWDPGFVSDALDLLAGLVTGVPVFLLECLPDRSAVELLQKEILKLEGGDGHANPH